jgi:transcriptional regulator of acetoin/glycerol metabolism
VDAQQAQVRKTLVPASQGLKAIENDLIRRAMQQTRGNVTDAARQLGISRATLYRRIALSKSGDK